MTPTSTNEWKRIPATHIPVHRIVGSQPTSFLSTWIRVIDSWSEITEDDAIYVIACGCCGSYETIDGHHRVRAAKWKRRAFIKARVASDEKEWPESIQTLFVDDEPHTHNFVSGIDSRSRDFTACIECGAEE